MLDDQLVGVGSPSDSSSAGIASGPSSTSRFHTIDDLTP
jgi:hypothetical protein